MESALRYGLWIFIGLTGLMFAFSIVVAILEIKYTKLEDKKLKKVQFWKAAIAIGFTLGNLALGITLKLCNVSLIRDDPAVQTIKAYYAHVDKKTDEDFEKAFQLLHPAYRARSDIKTKLPDSKELSKRYQTTGRHARISAEHDRNESNEVSQYLVNFDVTDTLDKATLFDYWDKPLSEAIRKGIVSADAIDEVLVEDIKRYFEVTDAEIVMMRGNLLKAPMKYVFGPKAVTETAMYYKLKRKSTPVFGGQKTYLSHFILYVTMRKDGDAWKIDEGLYPPRLEGIYELPPRKP